MLLIASSRTGKPIGGGKTGQRRILRGSGDGNSTRCFLPELHAAWQGKHELRLFDSTMLSLMKV
jgi:hypothetical protein